MCDAWADDFRVFLADMGAKPTPAHTLERVDNNGPYAPWNCVWATRWTQSRNTRRNHWVTWAGERLTIGDWSKRLGQPRLVLQKRLARGWSIEEALTKPLVPDRKTQARRRSSNRRLTFGGQTLTSIEWAERLGWPRSAIDGRLSEGWTIERTLTTPRRHYTPRKPVPTKQA